MLQEEETHLFKWRLNKVDDGKTKEYVADRIDMLVIFALNALCQFRRNDCQRNECQRL
jgi:hypothetical protein